MDKKRHKHTEANDDFTIGNPKKIKKYIAAKLGLTEDPLLDQYLAADLVAKIEVQGKKTMQWKWRKS